MPLVEDALDAGEKDEPEGFDLALFRPPPADEHSAPDEEDGEET